MVSAADIVGSIDESLSFSDAGEERPSRFETLTDILAWSPPAPTLPHSEYELERDGIKLCWFNEESSFSSASCITGRIVTPRIKRALAHDLRKASWKMGGNVAVESAKAKVFHGHPFPPMSSNLWVGEYGGVLSYFAEWKRTPMTVKDERSIATNGLEVLMGRKVGIQIRFPLTNPFTPRYELVARETFTHAYSGEHHSEREAVIMWARCQFDFAALICHWRGIMEEMDSPWTIKNDNYRPLEKWVNAADSTRDAQDSYLRWWGKKGFRRNVSR